MKKNRSSKSDVLKTSIQKQNKENMMRMRSTEPGNRRSKRLQENKENMKKKTAVMRKLKKEKKDCRKIEKI